MAKRNKKIERNQIKLAVKSSVIAYTTNNNILDDRVIAGKTYCV